MALRFDGAWRFEPPAIGSSQNRGIPDGAIDEFFDVIRKLAKQLERRTQQDVLELFKSSFGETVGTTTISSSSLDWAETDLRRYMAQAAENAPLFIEAFYDACESFRHSNQECFAPDVPFINRILAKHGLAYRLAPADPGDASPPRLFLEEAASFVEVPERPPTLAEQAIPIFQESLRRSEQLLAEGRGREAVQEVLWLLETVSTAFRGIDTQTGRVGGNYFNQIARDLRAIGRGTTFERAVQWMTTLHGYLSSPTGGGVRHGFDLNEGIAISLNEARLLCNLVRSYIHFLLVEHERFAQNRSAP